MENEQPFDWQRHPAAENLCLEMLASLRNESAALRHLAGRFKEEASTHLLDWVDHLLLPESSHLRDALSECGFVRQTDTAHEAWYHPGAQLPRVLTGKGEKGVALRVESIADFLQVHKFTAEIEGGGFSPYRRARASTEGGVVLLAVERRAHWGYDPVTPSKDYLQRYLEALELWLNRPRSAANEEEALKETERRVDVLVSQLGPDLAADVVCQGESRFWLLRNAAARVQKSRHEALGMGWGNHDHYTFRSSRRNFSRLVKLFSRLGFHLRERFYAGAEAGWGAQLMENPAAGLTLFLDVDLAPEEMATDFSGEVLPERGEYGTVGLWCALHGDSILGAGMHHLAARFDFERLTQDLARQGIVYMAPFSNFPYLKQAFSVAERWQIDPQRAAKLVSEKIISEEQANTFLEKGAVGSHLENIERREGYKGFNKKNVSLIIRETDPRN
jgi:hypothetical protein